MHKNDIYDNLISKVVRASKHIGDLQIECNRFDESQPYTIDLKSDPQTRETVYYLRSIKPLRPEIALITGDVLNNLRSALDHTMWYFATRSVSVPDKRKVYFPILSSASKYQSLKFRRKIEYLGQNVIDVLDTIKPYKGGNDALWKLCELNNLDKHRLLVPVAHINTARTETAAELEISRKCWTREHPNEVFIAADISRVVPSDTPARLLNAGDEIYRIASELNEQPKLVIEIALAEVGIAEGEPLIPTLHEIKMSVVAVIHKMIDVLGLSV